MQNETPRYITIILCLMQTIAPFLTQIFFVIAQSQEPKLKSIIKGYATMKFVYILDNMFAAGLPKSLTDNVNAINETDRMMMQAEDHNSIWNVFKRYYKSIRVTFGCQKTGAERLETT